MDFFEKFLSFFVQSFKIIFFFTGTVLIVLILIDWFNYSPSKDRNSLEALEEKVSTALTEVFATSPEKQACLSLKSIPKNYPIWCAVYHPQVSVGSYVVEHDLPYNITREYKNNKCIFTVFGEGIVAGNSYDFSFSCSIEPDVIKTCQNETPYSKDCVQKAKLAPVNDE